MSLSRSDLIQLINEIATEECLIVPKKYSKDIDPQKFLRDSKKSHLKTSAGSMYDSLRRNAIKRKEKLLTVEFFMKNLQDLDQRLLHFMELIEDTFASSTSTSTKITKDFVNASMNCSHEIRNQILSHLRQVFPEIICIKLTEL